MIRIFMVTVCSFVFVFYWNLASEHIKKVCSVLSNIMLSSVMQTENQSKGFYLGDTVTLKTLLSNTCSFAFSLDQLQSNS